MIRCFFGFSGYDSQALALRNIGVPFECVGWSEIDKGAIRARNALFPEDKDLNYGGIQDIRWLDVPNFDLFTYSFPCTDISLAGQMGGFGEGSGTRSSLLWDCKRAIHIRRPKYLIMENVKNIVSEKFMPFYLEWEKWLRMEGYTNFAKVINSADFGVPQSRERVFLVSIHGDAWYNFPQEKMPTSTAFDLLEENVHEKYFLSQAMLDYILTGTGNFEGGKVEHIDRKVCSTILSSCHKMHRASIDNYYTDKGRIRRLTPRECFRFMGMSEDDIDTIVKTGLSDTKMYQLAGNSIVIPVLEGIFKNLFLTNH